MHLFVSDHSKTNTIALSVREGANQLIVILMMVLAHAEWYKQVIDFVLYIIAFIISMSKRQINCPAVSTIFPNVSLVGETIHVFYFICFYQCLITVLIILI